MTALALSPVLFADFIRLDDYSHLFENPQLRRMSKAVSARLFRRILICISRSPTRPGGPSMIAGLFWGEANAWLFHAFNPRGASCERHARLLVVRTLICRCQAQPQSDALDGGSPPDLGSFLRASSRAGRVRCGPELKGELAAMFGLLGLWWHYRSSKRFSSPFSSPGKLETSAIVFRDGALDRSHRARKSRPEVPCRRLRRAAADSPS